jgi:uncharacterized membrane protein
MENKMFNIIFGLLIKLNIKISKQSLLDSLNSQPYKNSLDAIREILIDFNISSKSYNDVTFELLNKLPLPLIAQIKDKKEEFVVIESMDDIVIFSNGVNKKIKISVEKFRKLFTGIILLPFFDDNSEDFFYHENKEKEKSERFKNMMISILTGCFYLLFFIAVCYFHATNVVTVLFLSILKSLGLYITWKIVKVEMNKSDSLIQKICAEGNCDKVIRSKAAHPISWISMGDLGVIYFSGGLLSIVLGVSLNNTDALLTPLIIINILTLPFSLFSVFYQKLIVKTWCPLCLSVMGIFWIEFVCLIIVLDVFSLQISSFLLIFEIFTVCTIGWFLIKHIFQRNEENNNVKEFVSFVKKDVDLFKGILSQLPDRSFNETENRLVIGSSSAKYGIRLILSPSCYSCANLYKLAKRFISRFPDMLYVEIFFKSSQNEVWGNKVIEWLFSILESNGNACALDCYEYWQNMTDKNISFFEKYVTEKGYYFIHDAIEKRINQNVWLEKELNITFAPRICFNNKVLPNYYIFIDVINLIKRL